MTPTETISSHTIAHLSNCWKASDLRGTYPDEISPELFDRIGCAIGTRLGNGARVLVSGDVRLSTLPLKAALTKGLVSAGAHVLDAGQIPTPVAYFAESLHRPDAVLIVTASHNPPEHNGLKLLLGGRPPTPEQLAQIRERSTSDDFLVADGTAKSISPLAAYEQSVIDRWKHLDPNRLPRLVLDAGNGVWSESAPRVFSALNFTVARISCVIDGRFPDRPSDCSRPANLAKLREQVRNQPNTLGIAWDGDGDRVAIVDETGRAVSADEISMLLARELLASHSSHIPARSNKQVVTDIKLASTVEQEIRRLGGVPLLERTGHAFMRTRMVSTGAILGLDACGHFFFGELHGADDGLFAALYVLELMQRAQLPLSELLKTLPSTYGSPDLRIPLTSLTFKQAEQQLLSAHPNAEANRLDGVRLSLPEGTILIRASGTESVISLRIEGHTPSDYDQLVAQCLTLLPTAQQSIQSQLKEHLASSSR